MAAIFGPVVALPLFLATAALAQDAAATSESVTPESVAEMLKAAQGEDLLKATYAACLTLGGDGTDAVTEAFRLAGWEVDGDAEMGFFESMGPEEIFALTWTDGGYCLIQSEVVGSDRAGELFREAAGDIGLTATAQPDDAGGCLTYSLGNAGPQVEVTSSGNDPTCHSAGTSGVSFMWGEG